MQHTEMKKKSTKGTLDEHIRNHWGVKKRWNVYLSTFQTQNVWEMDFIGIYEVETLSISEMYFSFREFFVAIQSNLRLNQ